MTKQRTDRLNSLLKEVISEVIMREVKNPSLNEFITITHVSITKDLRHAKVYVSVIGAAEHKKKSVEILQQSAGYIATMASKKVVMRYFPALTFILDDSVDKQFRIEEVLKKIHEEEAERHDDPACPSEHSTEV